jgi:hypothetical protein
LDIGNSCDVGLTEREVLRIGVAIAHQGESRGIADLLNWDGFDLNQDA